MTAQADAWLALASDGIKRLIAAATDDRDLHRRAGRKIEALASTIRIVALKDALRAMAARQTEESRDEG